MTAYWIANTTVHNPDAYGEYAKLAGPAIEKHGGKFLARGATHTTLEGAGRPRTVVIRFDSAEAALACYHSPEYQAAHKLQQGAADRDIYIVEGV